MKMHYVEMLGERHPLCLSFTAAAALDERFGGLENMTDAMMSGSVSKRAEALDVVLTEMMRAGRVYAAAMGEQLPKPIPCKPSDLLSAQDGSALAAVFAAVRANTHREVKTAEGKAEATQGD